MSMGEFFATSQPWSYVWDTWGDSKHNNYKSTPREKIPQITKKELEDDIEHYKHQGKSYEDLQWKTNTEQGLVPIPIKELDTTHLIRLVNIMPKRVFLGAHTYKSYIRALDELQRRGIYVGAMLLKATEK